MEFAWNFSSLNRSTATRNRDPRPTVCCVDDDVGDEVGDDDGVDDCSTMVEVAGSIGSFSAVRLLSSRSGFAASRLVLLLLLSLDDVDDDEECRH